MKKIALAAVIMGLAFSVVAADQAKQQEYLELCKIYAKDDDVSAAEMDEYLESCVKELEESEKPAAE